MIKNVLKISNRQKLIFTVVFLYLVYSSLVQGTRLGLVQVAVLVIYLLFNIRDKDAHKISFILSLASMIFAVVLYILDITNAWSVQITKFSEWTYLFLLAGAVQLTCLNKINKKSN